MTKRRSKAVRKKAAKRDLQVEEFESRDLGDDIRTAGGLRAIRKTLPTSIVLDQDLVDKLREKAPSAASATRRCSSLSLASTSTNTEGHGGYLMEISKVEAASRLLDTAIRLFFEGADAVAVHSLAAASLNIFSDLAEHGGNSWRAHLGDDSKFSAPEVKRVLNNAWNFFKHADRDPDGTLQFEEIDSEHLMFVAILECGDLQTTSCCMQAFQLWYIAAHPDYFPKSESVFLDAMKVFPGLENLSSGMRIRRGHDFLEEHCPPCAPAE